MNVREAFTLLKSKGFRISVPGIHDIFTAEQAESFAETPDKFYSDRECGVHDIHFPRSPALTPITARQVSKRGHIYFLLNKTTNHIKIGFSTNPANRAKALNTANSCKLVLVGTVGGGQKREKKIHRDLREYNVSGEWFEWNAAVHEYIAGLGIKE